MKGLWRSLWLVTAFALLGCQGTLPGDAIDDPDEQDPYPPCTDPVKCCPAEKMQCVGDPDKGIICTCSDLWDCSKNPEKCDQDLPTPDGTAGWECTWTETIYTCEKTGTEDNPPEVPGGSDWYCSWNESEFSWVCTTSPPNPTNEPEGTAVWKCVVEGDKLVCERTDTVPDDNPLPPVGGGEWSCEDGVCTRIDSDGLPPSGTNWTCHQTTLDGTTYWVCYGESNTPPGGTEWDCEEVKTENGTTIWRCIRPEQEGDVPPGGGYWSCIMGTEVGGMVCEQVETEPLPPTPEGGGDMTCEINEKMWCDGLVYCGWGQVDCDPATGTWRTKEINGVTMLDCQEDMAGGKVPNTVCACYHFFFNPSCCERTDCIVPPGTDGQICPASAGGLCDYCNPLDPECVEAGAKCIVTNAHETFCGRDCSSQTCPSGYTCVDVKLKVGTTKQCVPSDYSCYY